MKAYERCPYCKKIQSLTFNVNTIGSVYKDSNVLKCSECGKDFELTTRFIHRTKKIKEVLK
jgi:transcription elongation factor Elf1